MIKFDRSYNSVIILCTKCPHWRGLRLNQAEAYRCGENHAVSVHDVEPARAAEPRELWEKRHAASA